MEGIATWVRANDYSMRRGAMKAVHTFLIYSFAVGREDEQVAALFRGRPLARHFRPHSRTSFFAMLEARRRNWNVLLAQQGKEKAPFPEFSKLDARTVGEAAKVSSPRLLDGPVGVADLRLDAYGDNFVIKPNWGSSSRGVLVLHRESDTVFVNIIDGSRIKLDDVRSRLVADIQRSGRGSTEDLVVEESMANGGLPAYEWKAYTFYGQVGLIQQTERSNGEICTKNYSPLWEDLGDVWRLRKPTSTLPPPFAPEKLMAAAIAVSLQVPTGFLRVDLFETSDGGVVLGELDFHPGGDNHFRGGLDSKMGRMWEDANVRLLTERKTLVP